MEAIYRVDGATAETSAFAGGPWDPKLQHGAAPSSLICWAVERLPSPVPMRVARLTVDLMRPVPVAPLTVETEVSARAARSSSSRCACWPTARRSCGRARSASASIAQEMPAIADGPPVELPMPELCSAPDFFATETPFLKGIEMRVAKGGFRIPGPAAVWYRATRPIVAGARDLAADARRHRRRFLQRHVVGVRHEATGPSSTPT